MARLREYCWLWLVLILKLAALPVHIYISWHATHYDHYSLQSFFEEEDNEEEVEEEWGIAAVTGSGHGSMTRTGTHRKRRPIGAGKGRRRGPWRIWRGREGGSLPRWWRSRSPGSSCRDWWRTPTHEGCQATTSSPTSWAQASSCTVRNAGGGGGRTCSAYRRRRRRTCCEYESLQDWLVCMWIEIAYKILWRGNENDETILVCKMHPPNVFTLIDIYLYDHWWGRRLRDSNVVEDKSSNRTADLVYIHHARP